MALAVDTAVSAEPAVARDFDAARRELIGFIDDLRQRKLLDVGTSNYVRIERALVMLAARGISPDEPRAAAWLAPLLCTSPDEQVQFHVAFADRFGAPTAAPSAAAPKREILTPVEMAVVTAARSKWRTRWIILALLFLVALGIGISALRPRGAAVEPTSAPQLVAWSEPIFWMRPLALVPLLLAFSFIYIRRSRQLWLLRAFAPAEQKSERVAFAAATGSFYESTPLLRSLGALRRHRAVASNSLHVGRTLSATIRAGGRPELRFGTRPRTPEYVLLVDQEAPSDHLPVAADLLLARLVEERIVVARYAYYGDPRRVVFSSDGAQPIALQLADLSALHSGSAILMFADARSCFDLRGAPHAWLNDLREWGRTVLLTPRHPSSWGWAERALDDEGFLVVPATSDGVAGYAERLKVGHDVPLPAWPRLAKHDIDLPAQLDARREELLDDKPPHEAVLLELLADLHAYLDDEAYRLLQVIAVFPRLEPALTLYLGSELSDRQGARLLTEPRFFALARLPWLRAGRMPDWLRLALVSRLEPSQLEEIIHLIQTFLQPAEDPLTGRVILDIARRRERGFREALLSWIDRDTSGQYEDQIFVGALRGRDPRELATPVPPSLARRLTGIFRDVDKRAVLVGVLLAAVIAITHGSIMASLRALWGAAGGVELVTGVARRANAVLGAGWAVLATAFYFWWFRHFRDKQPAGLARWLVQPMPLVALAGLGGLLVMAVAGVTTTTLSLVLASAITGLYVLVTAAPGLRLEAFPHHPFAGDHSVASGVWLALLTFGCLLPAALISMNGFSEANSIEPGAMVLVECVTIAWVTLGSFLWLRSVPQFKGSMSHAARVAFIIALGQSLIPLAVVGWLPVRVQSDGYILLRPVSAVLFATIAVMPAQFQWKELHARISLRLLAFGLLSPATLSVMHMGLGVFSAPPVSYAVAITFLSSILVAGVWIVAAEKANSLFLDPPPPLTWKQVGTTISARVGELMPWVMVPVLWLTEVVIVPDDEVAFWVGALELKYPLVAWLAYKYPQQARSVTVLGCLMLFFEFSLGPVRIFFSPPSVLAALCIVHLVSSPGALTRVFQADSISFRQIALLIFGIGMTVHVTIGERNSGWFMTELFLIIVAAIGLSRIRLRGLIVGIVVLEAIIAAGSEVLSEYWSGVAINVGHVLASPEYAVACVVTLLAIRGLRGAIVDVLERRAFPAPSMVRRVGIMASVALIAFASGIWNPGLAWSWSVSMLLLLAAFQAGLRFSLTCYAIALVAPFTSWVIPAVGTDIDSVTKGIAASAGLWATFGLAVFGSRLRSLVLRTPVPFMDATRAIRTPSGTPRYIPYLQWQPYDLIVVPLAVIALCISVWLSISVL